jgi:hypothetical protein
MDAKNNFCINEIDTTNTFNQPNGCQNSFCINETYAKNQYLYTQIEAFVVGQTNANV